MSFNSGTVGNVPLAIMSWDDFLKFIFAKRSLRGLEKLFVTGESGITTWHKFKLALIDEYQTATNNTQLLINIDINGKKN